MTGSANCPNSVPLGVLKNAMPLKIKPPQKIDAQGRVIKNPRIRAHRWRINIPASITCRRKERKFFESEAAAKDYTVGLLAARQEVGQDMVKKLRAKGMSVTEALEYAILHAPVAGKPVSLKQACADYITMREDLNSKTRYIANLESQFKAIQEDLGPATMIDAISKAKLEEFILGMTGKDGDTPASPKSRINYIITLSALFNFAVEQGWRGENPAAKLKRPKLDEVEIPILSPEDAQKLLTEARKPEYADIFPAVLVQVFAGPRRSEIPHITWALFKDRYLRLDKTKIRKKRAVELSDNLLAWLAPFRSRTGRIFAPEGVEFNPKDTRNLEDSYTYRLAEVAEAAKVALPKNVLRHTAITYRDAFTGDLTGTAAWAGNTPIVIEENYRGAATRDDALKVYAIMP